MKGVEPQLVYSGIFPPALRQNPREYDSIHSGFFLIRQKSTRYKLLRTENEIIFMDFSVQRRSNPWRVAIDDKPIKTENDSLSAIEFNSLHPKQQDTQKKWVPCFFEDFLGKGLTKMKTATSYWLIFLITALTENENPLGLLIKSKSIIGHFQL